MHPVVSRRDIVASLLRSPWSRGFLLATAATHTTIAGAFYATSTSTPRSDSDSDSQSRNESKTDTFNLIPPSKHLIQVNGCLPDGFLVNETRVDGSMIAFRDLLLRWKPSSYADVTIESLAPLLDIVSPPPDLLVLGCGSEIRQVDPKLLRGLMDRFVAVEALDTRNAVSTFNILNSEGRAVVGAFLPVESH